MALPGYGELLHWAAVLLSAAERSVSSVVPGNTHSCTDLGSPHKHFTRTAVQVKIPTAPSVVMYRPDPQQLTDEEG